MGGYKTPKEALNAVRAIGAMRARQPTDQLLLLSFVSGCYIAFGAYCALLVGGNVPGIQSSNPGIQKILYGIAFTVGLMMTSLTGSDLYTGNVFTITFAIFSKKTRVMGVVHALKGVILTFIGNMVGGLFIAYFFCYLLTPHDATDPWIHFLVSMSEKKVKKNVGLLLLSGIGCNWIVSTAVFMSYTAQDVSGKILSMFLPVMAFAVYGFEHVVANAFFLPAGAMFGAKFALWRIVFWNYLPVAIGNYIGGVICVGVFFWYAHMMRPKHHDFIENLLWKLWYKLRGQQAPVQAEATTSVDGKDTNGHGIDGDAVVIPINDACDGGRGDRGSHGGSTAGDDTIDLELGSQVPMLKMSHQMSPAAADLDTSNGVPSLQSRDSDSIGGDLVKLQVDLSTSSNTSATNTEDNNCYAIDVIDKPKDQ